jgi:hypothetical protein
VFEIRTVPSTAHPAPGSPSVLLSRFTLSAIVTASLP